MTFLLTDAVYTSPAETFPITLSSIPGASPLSPLTIQPAPGATVEISGNVTGAVLRLNDSDFIILDGSNSGGTSRDLTAPACRY